MNAVNSLLLHSEVLKPFMSVSAELKRRDDHVGRQERIALDYEKRSQKIHEKE